LALRVQQEWLVLKDLRVRLVPQASLDPKELRVILVPKDHKVRLVFKEIKDHRVRLVLKEHRVPRVIWVSKVRLELKDQRV